MKIRVPIIRTASDTPGTTRFNIGINLQPRERAQLTKEMRRRGNLNWAPPTEEVVVESSEESAHIMKEPPKGEQAIVGRTPITIKRRESKKEASND